MIAIVDSGSTKSDWIIISDNGSPILQTKTIGFNPYFIKSEAIKEEIQKNEDLMRIKSDLTKIYFYGAGCSSKKLQNIIRTAFDEVFPDSTNYIDHDLLAAAYAAYRGKPAIVCILGTGSNSCFFDGKNLTEETPSLAFILGDEGSGNHLGRQLIRYYFANKLPKNIHDAFYEKYKLGIEELNENVYQNNFANKYLATYSRFVAEHKHEPFMQNLIHNCINDFIKFQVLPYPQAATSEINFIGSIAFYYESILRSVAAEYNLNVGFIVQKPISNLVEYHKKYILN